MKCSQCAAELPAMATSCPQCGSSIPQGQLTAFSYLPPGAPPWPTTVSEKLPYLVEAGSSEPLMAGVHANGKVKPRRVSSVARRIMSVVLIVLLTPVVGVLGTLGVLTIQGQFPPNAHAPHSLSHFPSASGADAFSGSNVGSLPTPAPFTSTSDATMNISVQYPSDWTAGPADQSTDPIEYPITQPDQLVRIFIARFSTSSSSQIPGPDQLNARLITLMSQQVSNVTIVTPPSASPTIGNDQWVEQDVTFTDQNNLRNHFTTITVLHDRQNYYNINFVVPQSLYQQAMQEYIQPILSSFKFNS
jgi:PsbP